MLSNLLILRRFKNNQNERVVGLSEVAKRRREQRNVVTMKFNLINYLLETVSVLMSLLVKNFFVDLLYYLAHFKFSVRNVRANLCLLLPRAKSY